MYRFYFDFSVLLFRWKTFFFKYSGSTVTTVCYICLSKRIFFKFYFFIFLNESFIIIKNTLRKLVLTNVRLATKKDEKIASVGYTYCRRQESVTSAESNLKFDFNRVLINKIQPRCLMHVRRKKYYIDIIYVLYYYATFYRDFSIIDRFLYAYLGIRDTYVCIS